jgi:L-asparaginase
MEVKIFVTGGTIDGLEYSSTDREPTDKRTVIPALLRQAGVTVEYSVDVLMNKDSKFITGEDREEILRQCVECSETSIVITHGTVTMAETAKYLDQQNIGKTIVLVGAMVPANEENSDALFNLGAAFVAAQTLPTGVYIAMNGQVFNADNVTKNVEKGIFEKEQQ